MPGNSIWLGLLLASCVLAIDFESQPQGDDPALQRKNTCAMTQVLQAMNELLTSLSSEVRDIRRQVQTSCRGSDTRDSRRRPPKPQKKQEDKILDEGDDFFATFGKDSEEEKETTESPGLDYEEYDFGDGDEIDSPANDLIQDLSGWWYSIVPFVKPTEEATTTEAPIPPPLPDYYTDRDADVDADRDEEERYATRFPAHEDPEFPTGEDPRFPTEDSRFPTEDSRFPTDEDSRFPTDEDSRFATDDDSHFPTDEDTGFITPDFRNYYPPTTQQTPEYNPLPPEPINCPSPFYNQAGGCYLVFHDQRDWKSWGEADAHCLKYGGTLAAPHRLRQLQMFLTNHYSDAFWVGAKFDVPSRGWKWLNGKDVERTTWKQGQPSRNRNMKCIFLDKWSGYRATNFFCGEKYPFICDYRGPNNK
ncbi:RNA-binding protein 12B-like [Palaemon carinicauda]|uniref:RNA-binding protein 12B-like n=1 Tax=Palaemon carinicauda TaxID=392227 RepID=UPI0035B64CA6